MAIVTEPVPRRQPLVWLLLGHKAGDNNQVLALADRLGWPCEAKRIRYRDHELLANLLLRVTCAGIDRGASSPLEPPWPDLLITSGRRNEPVARWIRAQSGGRTRLVHIGRPWAAPALFDLVISTPQYDIGAYPNVLELPLPLHRLERPALRDAAAAWSARLAALPAPRIAVLLGGDSGAYVFTPAKARRLAALVDGLARSRGGSLLVTDSARTPAAAMDAFLGAIAAPLHCHRWSGPREDNPYLAYLGLADALVVTADSVSMVAEACFTGKPVCLFSLEDGPDWWKRAYNYRFRALVHRAAMRWGPRRMRRDSGRIVARLMAGGAVAWLGQELPQPREHPPEDAAEIAAQAVRALFAAR